MANLHNQNQWIDFTIYFSQFMSSSLKNLMYSCFIRPEWQNYNSKYFFLTKLTEEGLQFTVTKITKTAL